MASSKWKATEDVVTAIRNIENRKDTKRMDNQLQDFTPPTAGLEINFYTEEANHTLISLSELKRLVELAKGAKAEAIDIRVQEDNPLHAQLYDDDINEKRGEVVIAPRIVEDKEKLDRDLSNGGDNQ